MDTNFIIELIKTYGPDVLTILATGAMLVWNWKANHKSVTTQNENNTQALVKVTEVKVDIDDLKKENADLKVALKESIASNKRLEEKMISLEETIILRGGINAKNEEI